METRKILRRCSSYLVAAVAVLSFTTIGCVGVEDTKSSYRQAAEETAGPAPSLDELAELVGQDKAEAIYEGIGRETLDLLTYGAGVSNLVTMINQVTDVDKLVTLIGNDTTGTGLGALRTLALLNGVDEEKQTDVSTNILAGPNPPPNQDTLQAMIYFVENMPTVGDISNVVDLIDTGMAVSRTMDDGAPDPTNVLPNRVKVHRLARTLAHTHFSVDADLQILINLMSGVNSLCPNDLINRVGPIMTDMGDPTSIDDVNVLVEVIWRLRSGGNSDPTNMVDTLKTEDAGACGVASADPGVADHNDMIAILEYEDLAFNQLDGTKLGYVLHPVDGGLLTTDDLVTIIDNVTTPALMGELMHLAEDGQTWTGQVNGAWTWGSGTLGEPHDADSTIPRITTLINDLTGSGAALATIINGVTDQNKMVRVVQDVIEPSDLSALINRIDTLDPGSIPKLATIMEGINLSDAPKMVVLVDGCRGSVGTPPCLPADQYDANPVNISYIGELAKLMEALLVASQGPEKVAQLLTEVTAVEKVRDLTWDVNDVDGVDNLASIINDIDAADHADVNRQNAVHTLAVTIENLPGTDVPKLVHLVDNVSPANMSTLVNEVAYGENVVNGSGPDIAGTKVNDVISNITSGAGADGAGNLAYIINNVQNISQMSDLLVALSDSTGAGGTVKAANIINGVETTGNDLDNPAWVAAAGGFGAGRGDIDEMGKMVNMVDHVTDLSDVAYLIENIGDENKLITLINDVAWSSDLVGTLNAAIALGVRDDLVALVDAVDTTNDIPKLVEIVNNIGHATENDPQGTPTTPSADHTLVAELLQAPVNETAGVGATNMQDLITALGSCTTAQYLQANCAGTWDPADVTSATRLAQVMTGLNDPLCYDEDCGTPSMSKREGLVRIIDYGVDYDPDGAGAQPPVTFPGLGPEQLALMMNQAGAASDLVTLMNSTDLKDVVVLVGCGDHVTGFQTPCNSIGEGWP